MRQALFVLLFGACVVSAQDSASVLARILADKGTLSSAELAQVEAAAVGDRVGVLAALLQQKGVLTATDVSEALTQCCSHHHRRCPSTGCRPTLSVQAARFRTEHLGTAPCHGR